MSKSPTDRLAGVRAKIERANQHIQDLDAAWHVFRGKNPYGVRTETDPKSGKRTQRVEVREQIPDRIALIAGDAVHNLRSALDHLAWQLVEANGEVPTNRTAYPIRETPEKYEALDKAVVKGIAAGPLKVIEATQPYQAGYGDLWRLHEVDNFDKHRLLIVAAFRLTSVSRGFSPAAAGGMYGSINFLGVPLAPPATRVLQDGQMLAVLGPANGLEANVDTQLTYDVVFRQPQVVEFQAIYPFLTQLRQLVECIVNQFVPFLQ